MNMAKCELPSNLGVHLQHNLRSNFFGINIEYWRTWNLDMFARDAPAHPIDGFLSDRSYAMH